MEFKKFWYILNIEYNMSFEIYSEQFYKELDKKIEKVENENSEVPFLPKEEYAKQQKIIEDFLKKTKLKIYGGIALDKFMPANDKIYTNKEGKLVDYDTYSPTPLKHAVELGNILFNAGFKYITVKEGVNTGVYKIFNSFQEAVDIVFMPQRIYDIIPSEAINGLVYVLPKHLKIDLLVALTNPKQAIFRWQKDFDRLQKLEKYFPTEKPKIFCQSSRYKYTQNPLEKKIKEYIFSRNDYILFGDYAYYSYMEYSGLKDYFNPDIKYLEIGMQNPATIFDDLRKITNGQIKIKKYHPFMKHIPGRFIVTDASKDTHILLIIYELNEKCIPYISYKNMKIVTYHGLVLYYNFMIYISERYGIKDRQEIAECCLYDLERAKNYFFHHSKKNEFDDTIFRCFILPCLGKEKNILKDSKIKLWTSSQTKMKSFSYVPFGRSFLVSEDKVPPGIVKFVSGEFDKDIHL
jgi:hypothetical protein